MSSFSYILAHLFYTLNCSPLDKVAIQHERFILDVIMNSQLKFHMHSAYAVSRTNSLLHIGYVLLQLITILLTHSHYYISHLR